MQIVIDNRERELISKFTSKSYPFVTGDLSKIGDVLFLSGHMTKEEPSNQNIVRCYERKTFTDLFASLCDGRALNQLRHMLSIFDNKTVWYILEMTTPKDIEFSRKPGVIGFLTTLDSLGVHRITTSGVEETAGILHMTKKKMEASAQQIEAAPDDVKRKLGAAGGGYVGYRDLLQAKKKEVYSPVDIQLAQLCMIPNISSERAFMIMDHYGDITSFLVAARDRRDETIGVLAEMKRLGVSRAQKVVDCFMI